MTNINQILELPRDKIAIECSGLIPEITPDAIMDAVETFFGTKYFQDREQWEYEEYPYIVVYARYSSGEPTNTQLCGSSQGETYQVITFKTMQKINAFEKSETYFEILAKANRPTAFSRLNLSKEKLC